MTVQDAAVKCLAQQEPIKKSAPFMFTVARNAERDIHRRHGHQIKCVSFDLDHLVDRQPPQDSRLIRAEQHQILGNAIRRLTRREQRAICRMYLHGHERLQVAMRLKCSIKALEDILYRACRKLERALGAADMN